MARPVSISRRTRASYSVPMRSRSSAVVCASGDRSSSVTAFRRTAGSAFASSVRATRPFSTRRRRLLVPTRVSASRGVEPTGFSVTGSRRSAAGSVSSADVATKTP